MKLLCQDDVLLGSPNSLIDDPGVSNLELNSVTVSSSADYKCVATYQGIGTITSDPKPVYVRGERGSDNIKKF